MLGTLGPHLLDNPRMPLGGEMVVIQVFSGEMTVALHTHKGFHRQMVGGVPLEVVSAVEHFVASRVRAAELLVLGEFHRIFGRSGKV